MDHSTLPPGTDLNFHQPPPLLNPPPRIFGSLSANGSPLQANFPGPFFPDDGALLGDDGGEHSDAKRRRIARVMPGM